MPSINDAATLFIYRVPNGIAPNPIDLMQGIINRIQADTDLKVIDSTGTTKLRSDFKVDYYRKPSFKAEYTTLKISLPVGIYDCNTLAWRHLDVLRRALLKKGVECNWAPCESNDRTTSCVYFITPTLPSTDLRLKGDWFRLAILNTAAEKIGVTPSRHVWLNDGRNGEGIVTGRITFNSPSEIDTLIKVRGVDVEGRDKSKHLVVFQPDQNQLAVTSCTTVGLVISIIQAFDMETYKAAINDILDVYNHSLPEGSTPASVNNFRTCPRLLFLLCDPSDIQFANSL